LKFGFRAINSNFAQKRRADAPDMPATSLSKSLADLAGFGLQELSTVEPEIWSDVMCGLREVVEQKQFDRLARSVQKFTLRCCNQQSARQRSAHAESLFDQNLFFHVFCMVNFAQVTDVAAFD
jgi:hypothetical protein